MHQSTVIPRKMEMRSNDSKTYLENQEISGGVGGGVGTDKYLNGLIKAAIVRTVWL